LLTTGKNADGGLSFFRHSGIPAFTDHALCISTLHQQCGSEGVFISIFNSVDLRVYTFKSRNAGLYGIQTVWNELNDAGRSPVPE
jgi:hypothetical protein